MRPTPHLLLILAFLAFLGFQTSAFPLFESNSLRKKAIMNTHATSSGIVDIKKDSYDAFYVEADLSTTNSYSSQRNSSNSPNLFTDRARMMISIVNGETMVATKCFDFSYYNCLDYNCQNYNVTGTIDYPTFTANVQYVKGSIYLDYNYWSLNTALYIAYDCQTGDNSTNISSGKYGVLGLGIPLDSRSDFTSGAIFSIWINSKLTRGKLLFKKDTDGYAQSSTPLASLIANSTWQKMIEKGGFTVNGYSFDIEGSIMFDINSDAIGLLQPYFRVLLNNFALPLGIWCNEDNYKPFCYYTNPAKKIEDLPDITLSVNDVNITIPWKIYASPVNSSAFYLNFKAIDPHRTGKSYVTPSFRDSIILDANFMSYYYTVFDDTGDSSPMIYLYPSTNAPPIEPSFVKWIVLGAIGIVLLAGGIFYCAKKKQTVPTSDGAFISKTQAPIVYSQQEPQGGGGYVPPVTNFQERAQQ